MCGLVGFFFILCINDSSLCQVLFNIGKIILRKSPESSLGVCEEYWRAVEDMPPVPASTLNVPPVMSDDREMSVSDIHPIAFNHQPQTHLIRRGPDSRDQSLKSLAEDMLVEQEKGSTGPGGEWDFTAGSLSQVLSASTFKSGVTDRSHLIRVFTVDTLNSLNSPQAAGDAERLVSVGVKIRSASLWKWSDQEGSGVSNITFLRFLSFRKFILIQVCFSSGRALS